MSIVYNKQTRRQFLVGAGKLALSLPILPSLLPEGALAASTIPPKRMAFFNFGHCLVKSKWINPNLATTSVGADGAKEVLLSSLSAGAWGSPISPILSHPFYEKIRSKGQITVVRGIDNMIHGAGHGGQYLSGSSQRADEWNPIPFPSIDVLFESSPTLYPSTTASNVKKVIRLDNGDIQSSYKKVGSEVVEVPGYGSADQLFKDLFSSLSGASSSGEVDKSLRLKKSILGKVYDSYVSVKNSRKISSTDKSRFEEHIALISDLEKKLSATSVIGTSDTCIKPTAPGSGLSYLDYNRVSLQLMTMAIKCGLSKVFVIDFEGHIGDGVTSGLPKNVSLHNGIFHNNEGQNYTEAQINDYYVAWKKWHMNLVADNFLSYLDVAEGDSGRTYLDNMLTAMLSEGGMDNSPGTHTNVDYQPVLFGTMGGYLKGDRFTVLPTKIEMIYQHTYPYRIPYNSLLITFLEAMKIPSSEYSALSGGKGFGIYKAGQYGQIELPEYNKYFGHRFYSPISEILKG